MCICVKKLLVDSICYDICNTDGKFILNFLVHKIANLVQKINKNIC